MNKNKHTEGPWTAFKEYPIKGTNIEGPDGKLIANCTDKNAALIAAAPELLEAAELLLYKLEVCLDDLYESEKSSFDADDEIQKMKNIIAKARGES